MAISLENILGKMIASCDAELLQKHKETTNKTCSLMKQLQQVLGQLEKENASLEQEIIQLELRYQQQVRLLAIKNGQVPFIQRGRLGPLHEKVAKLPGLEHIKLPRCW